MADEAKDGFIIFTLGSLVNVSSMTEEMVGSFIGAFSQLPQRVFWKWEGDIPKNVPSNVMMVNWLPQQDLLGKVQSFISDINILNSLVVL